MATSRNFHNLSHLLWPGAHVADVEEMLRDSFGVADDGAVDFVQLREWAQAEAERGGMFPEISEAFALWMTIQADPVAWREGTALLEFLAGSGLPSACFNLAMNKIKGVATAVDFVGALALLETVLARAADNKKLLGMAHASLGDAFAMGRGVAIDGARAQKHYETAAGYGCAEAAFNAGLYFDDKASTSLRSEQPDFARAAHFYEIAVRGGDVAAQTNLGVLYAFGRVTGVGQGVEHGLMLLRRSAADGDAAASEALRLYAEVTAADHGPCPSVADLPVADWARDLQRDRARIEDALYSDFPAEGRTVRARLRGAKDARDIEMVLAGFPGGEEAFEALDFPRRTIATALLLWRLKAMITDEQLGSMLPFMVDDERREVLRLQLELMALGHRSLFGRLGPAG